MCQFHHGVTSRYDVNDPCQTHLLHVAHGEFSHGFLKKYLIPEAATGGVL